MDFYPKYNILINNEKNLSSYPIAVLFLLKKKQKNISTNLYVCMTRKTNVCFYSLIHFLSISI